MTNHRQRLLFVAVAALAAATLSCGKGGAGAEAVPTLDLAAAIDNPCVFDLTEIAERIEYIPLDASVPVGEIAMLSGVVPVVDGFYILDAEQMSPVQHFDRSGRFVAHVGRMGRGPDETTFVQGITPNAATGEVYIDGVTDIVGLDASGREFARMQPEITWSAVWYGDRLLTLPVPSLFEEGAYSGDSLPFIETFDRDLKPAGTIRLPNPGPFMGMPTTPVGDDYVAGISPPFFSDNGRRLLVKQGRGDVLYEYGDGGLTPAYILDAGRYAPPAEVFGLDPAALWNERNFTVTNMWEGDRYVIVAASNIIEKQSRGLVLDCRNLAGGGFSATGADGTAGLSVGGIAFTPCYIRDNRLVGYMRALDMADNAGRITDPDLKSLAATTMEDSNPVLLVAELKR